MHRQGTIHSGESTICDVFRRGMMVSYAAGDIVVRQGQRDDGVFLVDEGQVEVVALEGGTEIIFAVLGPGELVGEVGFLDGSARTRSLRAHTNCRLLRLERESVCAMHPADQARFYHVLASVLATRFRSVIATADGAPSPGPTRPRLEQRAVVFAAPSGLDQVRQDLAIFKERFVACEKLGAERGEPGIHQAGEDAVGTLLDELDFWLTQVVEPYEAEADDLSEEIGRLVRRELHPWLMRSHLFERIYARPLRTPFDYLAQEHVRRHRPSGEDALGVGVDHWLLGSGLLSAYRSRQRWLGQRLERACRRQFLSHVDNFAPIEVLALALGAAQPVWAMLDGCRFSDQLHITLVDEQLEALQYADTRGDHRDHHAVVRYVFERLDPTDQTTLLGAATHGRAARSRSVVCLGPDVDILDDEALVARVAACRATLTSDGSLLLGALGPAVPQLAFARLVLGWPIRARTSEHLADLVATGFGFGDVDVSSVRGDVRVAARALHS